MCVAQEQRQAHEQREAQTQRHQVRMRETISTRRALLEVQYHSGAHHSTKQSGTECLMALRTLSFAEPEVWPSREVVSDNGRASSLRRPSARQSAAIAAVRYSRSGPLNGIEHAVMSLDERGWIFSTHLTSPAQAINDLKSL